MNDLSEPQYQQETQLTELDFEAQDLGHGSIVDLFEEEPELFDVLAQEWRQGHS